jgi:hypothetical protein
MNLVRKAVEQHDSREVIYGVQTLDSVVAGSLAARRITMVLWAYWRRSLRSSLPWVFTA